jgi:hypothetical protein
MNSANKTALGLVALLIGSCTYPDFDFGELPTLAGMGGMGPGQTMGSRGDTPPSEDDTTGAGITTGAGSTAAATTSGGGVTTGTGEPGGVCVISHPGGGECEYLPGKQCNCEVGENCGVSNEATGAASCINTGNLPAGQKCANDGACAAGTWCDHFTSTCQEICEVVGTCNKGAVCLAASNEALSAIIPGLRICTSNCDPLTAVPCGTNATCQFDASDAVLGFDCFASGLKKEGEVCTRARDCGKGLTCVNGTPSATCERWCTPVGSTFPAAANRCSTAKPKCIGFLTPIERNGVEFGTCKP